MKCPVCAREGCAATKDPHPYRDEMEKCWRAAGARLAKMESIEAENVDLTARCAAAQASLARHHARQPANLYALVSEWAAGITAHDAKRLSWAETKLFHAVLRAERPTQEYEFSDDARIE